MTTRLPPEVLEEIENIAERERIDRSELIRRLLDHALAQRRINDSVEAYRRGEVTMWKAAEQAEVSLREMINILNESRIELNYSVVDLERDLEYARKRSRSE